MCPGIWTHYRSCESKEGHDITIIVRGGFCVCVFSFLPPPALAAFVSMFRALDICGLVHVSQLRLVIEEYKQLVGKKQKRPRRQHLSLFSDTVWTFFFFLLWTGHVTFPLIKSSAVLWVISVAACLSIHTPNSNEYFVRAWGNNKSRSGLVACAH